MFPNQRNVRMEGSRVDKQSQLSPSNPKIPSWPKIPSFVDTPKCPAWRNPLALGHGTAWDHYQMENFLHPTLKYPAAPKYPAPSIPVFLSTSLGFWDMGQHGTNGKLPENKSWSLCQHPLALGRPGLKKNVVSLGR